jgi:hypothetical protein
MLQRQSLELANVFVLDNDGKPWGLNRVYDLDQEVFDEYHKAANGGG